MNHSSESQTSHKNQPTLRTADAATQAEYAVYADGGGNFATTAPVVQMRNNFVFAVDLKSWRMAISYMWLDQLRESPPATIDTLGADLQAGDVVLQSLTCVLYRLIRRISTSKAGGRVYSLWDVEALNTPAQAEAIECHYTTTVYKVLVEG